MASRLSGPNTRPRKRGVRFDSAAGRRLFRHRDASDFPNPSSGGTDRELPPTANELRPAPTFFRFGSLFAATSGGVAFRPPDRCETAMGFFYAPVDVGEWFSSLLSHIHTYTMIKYIHTNSQYQFCANIQQSQQPQPAMVPK